MLWCFATVQGANAERAGLLEFSEPAIASDPSLGTQIRLDHRFRDEADGERYTAELEMEFMVAPWASLELSVPYTYHDPEDGGGRQNLDSVSLEIKLASYALAESGILLGTGLELVLPTGEDRKGIGSNNEIWLEPYVAIGAKFNRFEIISSLALGIPANQSKDDRPGVDLEIGFNTAMIYRAASQYSLFLELDGESVLQGSEEEVVLNGTAGLLWRPFDTEDFVFGFGASVPLTRDQEFSVQTIFWTSYDF